MYKLRKDDKVNSMLEVMEENEKYQDEPYVGCFWYDTNKKELYGVGKSPAKELSFYHSIDWNKEIKTSHQLHKNIWQKQHYRGKDKRFTGDYTQKPRGRVFEFKNGGFKVCVGKWIKDYPEALEEILFEFQLDKNNTQVLIDEHWDLGHGWSNDYLNINEKTENESILNDVNKLIGNVSDNDLTDGQSCISKDNTSKEL